MKDGESEQKLNIRAFVSARLGRPEEVRSVLHLRHPTLSCQGPARGLTREPVNKSHRAGGVCSLLAFRTGWRRYTDADPA
jgi:hypothetical protein